MRSLTSVGDEILGSSSVTTSILRFSGKTAPAFISRSAGYAFLHSGQGQIFRKCSKEYIPVLCPSLHTMRIA